MVKSCCRLGAAINQERVLCKTPNFFVLPTLGSLGIEGYVLIVPNAHVLGFAMLPSEHLSELNELKEDVKKLLLSEYGESPLIFEHGPRVGPTPSGQSIDHAHLHVVPARVDITDDWAVDLTHRLGNPGDFYRMDRVKDLERAREMCNRGTSYLYVENPRGFQLLSEQNFPRPPQYFRKMVADKIGIPTWDWKKHPDYETLDRTLKTLQGKF
jgi:diadenosine tetraphosphate (Ap4A) HIT family hydrolase